MSMQQSSEEKQTLESVLRQLLPEGVVPLVNPDRRAIAVLWEQNSTIEFLTPTEWSILLVLARAYPHYAPYAWLVQRTSSYSLEQTYQLLGAASSASMRNRLLKPIHRALSSLRKKLQHLHAYLNISHVYETGYALISPTSLEKE
jgi:hypothetical protein